MRVVTGFTLGSRNHPDKLSQLGRRVTVILDRSQHCDGVVCGSKAAVEGALNLGPLLPQQPTYLTAAAFVLAQALGQPRGAEA
jgi:hypothetical protein